MLIAPLALLLLLLLVLVLFVLPIWLLVSGILRVADGRRGAGRIAVATVWLLFTAFALDSTFGPLPRPSGFCLTAIPIHGRIAMFRK